MQIILGIIQVFGRKYVLCFNTNISERTGRILSVNTLKIVDYSRIPKVHIFFRQQFFERNTQIVKFWKKIKGKIFFLKITTKQFNSYFAFRVAGFPNYF